MLQRIGPKIESKRQNGKVSFKATPDEIVRALDKTPLSSKTDKVLRGFASFCRELGKELDRPYSYSLRGNDNIIPKEIAKKAVNGVTFEQMNKVIEESVVQIPLSASSSTDMVYFGRDSLRMLLKGGGSKNPDIILIG